MNNPVHTPRKMGNTAAVAWTYPYLQYRHQFGHRSFLSCEKRRGHSTEGHQNVTDIIKSRILVMTFMFKT